MISRNEAIHPDDAVNQPVAELSIGLAKNRAGVVPGDCVDEAKAATR